MKKPTKRQIAKDNWIKETQMFQRIGGVNESTYEDLSVDYDSWFGKRSIKHTEIATDNVRTMIVITEVAGKPRNN